MSLVRTRRMQAFTRGTAGLLLLLLAPGAVADPVTGWGFQQFMAGMRSIRTSNAHFVEWKTVRVLKDPLQSSGTLSFTAPDRLEKQTLAPSRSRLAVAGDRLTIQEPDGRVHDLALSQSPEVSALVESIRATLAGDEATLMRYYTPTLMGTAADWSLVLEPRDQRVRELLAVVRMRGERTNIRYIETMERDGDRTAMTITPDQE